MSDLDAKTVKELIALCKERKISGYSGKRKEKLIELLSGDVTEKPTSKIELSPPSIPKNKSMNWDTIIAENKYINTKKESCKDEHSFCTLVDVPMTQSQNISLGMCMEKLFHDAIGKNTELEDISGNQSKKGERQKDHIWLDKAKREIIYAEQKNNINLDTEKSVSTETKVAEVAKKYPEYKISAYILAARYLTASEPLAKKIIQTKYKNTKVIGVNDYLALFNLPPFENYDAYKRVIHKVVQTKFVDDTE